jgi:hypothetical protein
MTEGNNPLSSDKIANLRMEMTRIEAMQTVMTNNDAQCKYGANEQSHEDARDANASDE